MYRTRTILWSIIQFACLVGAPSVALAQERHERGGHPGPAGHGPQPGQREGGRFAAQHPRGQGWRGDIRRFPGHDLQRWHSGRWYHGAHDGRRGWWWIVGPSWYFYAAPVYPYPDPYLPAPMLEMAPPPPPGAPPQYWFYCADPPGYYPYVTWCRSNWRPVPARPAP